MIDYVLVIVPHVRRHRHRFVVMLDPVCHRICRVVIDRERLYLQIADKEIHIRTDRMVQLSGILSQILLLRYLFQRFLCPIERNTVFSCQDSQSLCMVRMLVCDDDSVELAAF